MQADQSDPQGVTPIPDHDYEKRFGRSVRQLREGASLSQPELAKRLEVYEITIDPSAISRLESGNRIIRLNEAIALAQVFGRPVDELIAPPTALDQLMREAEADVNHANRQAEEAHQKLTTAVSRVEHLRHRVFERYTRVLQEESDASSPVPQQLTRKPKKGQE